MALHNDNGIQPRNGDGAVARPSPAKGKRPRSTPGRKRMLRVLLVDESETASVRTRAKLARIEGVKIVGATHDVPTAVNHVKRFQGHVVILDPVLQGLDSAEVLASIKKKPQPAQVILYSSIDQPELRKKYFDAGADFFFGRETDYPALCSVLRHLARKVTDPVTPRADGPNLSTAAQPG